MHNIFETKGSPKILNRFNDNDVNHSYYTWSSPSYNFIHDTTSRFEIQKSAFSSVEAKIWDEICDKVYFKNETPLFSLLRF